MPDDDLRERNCIRQDERSGYAIAGDGVDYVESHLPPGERVYRSQQAPQSGDDAHHRQ